MQAEELQFLCDLLIDVRHYLAVLFEYVPDVIKQGLAPTHTMTAARLDMAIDTLLQIAPDETLKMKSYALRENYGH